jgi:hypothetical protein
MKGDGKIQGRLCYLGRELELRDGEFTMGRHASCDFVLDDPLASRKHARLHVSQGEVGLEDLDSRNGVLVNGQPIGGRHPLGDGDRITIGGQEIIFRRTSKRTPTAVGRVRLSTMSRTPESWRDPSRYAASTLGRSDVSRDARLEALRYVWQLAQKALADGQHDEAERVCERPLAEVISSARNGLVIDHGVANLAAESAVRLAGATKKGYWIDYVFDLFTVLGVVLPSATLAQMDSLIASCGPLDLATLRVYVAKLERRSKSFSAPETDSLQRTRALLERVQRAPTA